MAQVYTQRTELRDYKGETLAHYCGTQYGANRLCTADGKTPLCNHSLFTVSRLAVDGVTLKGAHPPVIKNKLVHTSMQQWDAQFKLVNDSDPEKVTKRVKRALEERDDDAVAAHDAHPDCYGLQDFHTQATSKTRKASTNTVFDVRGHPVIIGDVMLGLKWEGDDFRFVLRVPRQVLMKSEHYDYQDEGANYDAVPTVPANHWEQIEKEGTWYDSLSLRNNCYVAVGYVRIVQGDKKQQPKFEDPFFLVMKQVPTDADPMCPSYEDNCDVVFVPRHVEGQSSVLVSDLPSAHAIMNFIAFNRDHSRWMQVCYMEPLWVFSGKYCLHTTQCHVACYMFRVAIEQTHVAIV